MKAKYLLYVSNAAANALWLLSERFDSSTPSASYANEAKPRHRTDCRHFFKIYSCPRSLCACIRELVLCVMSACMHGPVRTFSAQMEAVKP